MVEFPASINTSPDRRERPSAGDGSVLPGCGCRQPPPRLSHPVSTSHLQIAHGLRVCKVALRVRSTNQAGGFFSECSASSISTATTFETSCSGIVMPTSCSAISIVILLWLMNRNWVCRAMRRTRSQKRS